MEVHTELKGFTKTIFNIFKFFDFKNNIKFILINKNLNKKIGFKKRDFIVLDDCVDARDFKPIHKKAYACLYTGSFVKGKGIETILNIASLLPKVNFILYGDLRTLDTYLYKNIIKQKNIF